NAGFVEVDVAVDEARDHQAAIEALFGRVSGDALSDLDDSAACDGDVDGRLFVGPPALTQQEIEGHGGHRDADVSFYSELDVELFQFVGLRFGATHPFLHDRHPPHRFPISA